MKLSKIKELLKYINEVTFELPDGSIVPSHFHVTEVGKVTRHFIDCGGTERVEEFINFQLWTSTDYEHKLAPKKLINIIELSEKSIGLNDSEIEVEYQHETIGKYSLDFNGKNFMLTPKKTACLAEDACGIPQEKPRIKLSELNKKSCCN